MTINTIHASATSIKSRDSASTNFTSFIFACLKQIDADPETSAQELRLAFVISQMTNKKTRVCFPLQSKLAKRLGVSDRAIREYIAGLVDRGHLRVRHRGRDNSSIYELILQDRNAASGLDTVRPEDTFRSSADDPSEDRKFHVARPEVSRRKTGTVLPTEPTSITNLNNQPPSSSPKRGGKLRSSGRRRSSTPPPETISVEMTDYAVEKGWTPTRAAGDFEKFRDYHLAKGNTYADWLAAWRTWVRRGVAYDQPQPQGKTIDQNGNEVAPLPNRGQRQPPPRRQTNTERMMAGGR